jgi:hypothetical protein
MTKINSFNPLTPRGSETVRARSASPEAAENLEPPLPTRTARSMEIPLSKALAAPTATEPPPAPPNTPRLPRGMGEAQALVLASAQRDDYLTIGRVFYGAGKPNQVTHLLTRPSGAGEPLYKELVDKLCHDLQAPKPGLGALAMVRNHAEAILTAVIREQDLPRLRACCAAFCAASVGVSVLTEAVEADSAYVARCAAEKPACLAVLFEYMPQHTWNGMLSALDGAAFKALMQALLSPSSAQAPASQVLAKVFKLLPMEQIEGLHALCPTDVMAANRNNPQRMKPLARILSGRKRLSKG